MQPDSSIQYQSYSSRKTITAIVLSIALFFIILLTISIVFPILHQSAILPIDTSNNQILNQINLDDVNLELKTLLSNTYDTTPQELSNLKAIIRENSITYSVDENNNLANASFLIDLNNPKLTFQVEYQKNVDFVALLCPPIELAQDQNVFCIGYNGQSTIDANLDKYLPYQGFTPNGTYFSIWHDYDDKNKPFLNTYANACDDEESNQEASATIKYWLMQHGIANPDIIPINLQTSNCTHHE